MSAVSLQASESAVSRSDVEKTVQNLWCFRTFNLKSQMYEMSDRFRKVVLGKDEQHGGGIASGIVLFELFSFAQDVEFTRISQGPGFFCV